MKVFAAFLMTCALLPAFADTVPTEHVVVLPNAQLATRPSPPPGFIPPPLNPKGIRLETRQLSDGVYALMSNTPFADNAGFIVGESAVLVIDSHFNGEMGQQIIDAVRAVTDLPIRYLLNTNAFGDHVFGNHVFPDDTLIVAHQSTIDSLSISTVEGIAQTMRGTVSGDLSVSFACPTSALTLCGRWTWAAGSLKCIGSEAACHLTTASSTCPRKKSRGPPI